MANIFVLLLTVVLFLCSCQPPLPDNINNIYTDWFINANEEGKKLLTSYKLSSEMLDSLALLAQSNKIKTGAHSCALSDQDGTKFILGLETPTTVAPDSLYPLIVYLHGGIGTTRNDKGEKAYEMFRFLADTIDLFLASPSANRTVPWWSAAGLNRILKTVRYMTFQFPIDPDRIILAGVSDGATGCYAAANAINDPFAGFIAISGWGGILPRFGMELYPSNIMQRPIYNINGGKDHLYPINAVEEFLNWLEENGVSVTRKIYPEEGHGFDYRKKETTPLMQLIHAWHRPVRETISWTIVKDVPNLAADNLLSWTICNNDAEKRILAYWQQDTLNIRTNGICSFSMLSEKKSTTKVFSKTSDGTIKPLQLQELNTEQHLELIQHFCYPRIKEKKIFHIELK